MEFKSTFIENSNKVLIDEASATVTYVWNAVVWADENNSVWVIRKLTQVWQQFSVEFAEWDTSFNKIWADRATYTYS